MKECGASTQTIDLLVASVASGGDYWSVIETLPTPVKNFVKTTLNIALYGEDYEVAAAFTIGRENLIPSMFIEFVEKVSSAHPEEMDTLLHYFQRHIDVDGDDHGPLALKMLLRLCDNDSTKIARVIQIAEQVLASRLQLWDGAMAAMESEHLLETAEMEIA
jgi:hypothetical protein